MFEKDYLRNMGAGVCDRPHHVSCGDGIIGYGHLLPFLRSRYHSAKVSRIKLEASGEKGSLTANKQPRSRLAQ